MKTDMSHIRACRAAIHAHLETCPECRQYAKKWPVCLEGRACYEEFVASISAHRECEKLTATEASNGI